MFLPDTIPCDIGELTGPAAPITGNGWEVRVLAHTDFATPVCWVPRFMSLQFAKILKDKGSGTITLSMDDPFLFPPGVQALNPNADLADGLAGWTAHGGTVTIVAPGPPGGPLSTVIFLTPDGVSPNSYVAGSGHPFATVPGQRYTVRTSVYSPTGYASVILGMVFSDTYGNTTVVRSAAASVLPGAWTPYGATVTAPEGTVTGWPLVGQGASPAPGNTLYAAGAEVTYESLEPTALQPAGTVPASTAAADLPPGSATAGEYLLSYEHLWQVWRDGQLLFEFTGQTVTEQQADTSEQRVVTITGPGTVNVLSWARAMPPGFPNIVFKTDAIQDGFAEIDIHGFPALDTNIWDDSAPLDHITLNPQGTCQITASPGTTFLGATPYDVTTSSISAQINAPFLLAGSGSMDGSQVAQFYVQSATDPTKYALIGLTATEFFAQVGGVPGGATATKNLGTYSATAHLYWRISELAGVFTFWTSADGVNWVVQWSSHYDWDATRVTVFFTVTYHVDATVAIGVTNINSEIITPSSTGNIYLLTPIMGVWDQIYQQARGRGTIPMVTTRLNGRHDSFGNPWTDAMSVQIQNGTDLFSLLQAHAAIVNADWIMQPGFVLEVGLPTQNSGGLGLGRDFSDIVVIRESKELTERQRVRARDQVQNVMGAVNTDGTVVSAQDTTSVSRYQQREGWVETAQAVNPASMKIVLAASLGQFKDEVLSETISVLPDRPGSTPLLDFDVGDWVGRERPAATSPYVDVIRVVGVAFGIDATGGVTAELTINTFRQYIEQQFAYLASKFGGQFINAVGTVPVTSTGNPSQVPVPVAPPLSGLSDVAVGTDHQDPLVWNALAGLWQNASNPNPTGSALGLAVGPSGGSKAALVPASSQTISVDGGAAGTLLSAFQAPSAAGSETAPATAVPVVFNLGATNEQLALLFAAGLSGHQTHALLLVSASADGTSGGKARIGTMVPGGSTTWAFTTVQSF